MRLPRLALALFAAAAAVTAAHAQRDPLAAAINARQGIMQVQSFHLGILANMVRGNAPYEAEAAQQAADALAATSMIALQPVWPQGTSHEDYESTRALTAVWDDWEGFEAAWTDYVAAANAMQDVAGDGLEAIQAQMGALGGTCGACHEDYRVSN